MARLLPTPNMLPKYELTSAYEVRRMGPYPLLRVETTECVFQLLPPLVVLGHDDTNGDTLFEVLHVTEFGNSTGAVGLPLCDASSTVLATIETVVAAADGMSTALTLSTGLSAAQLAAPLALVATTPLGAPVYIPAPRGLSWNTFVEGSSPGALAEISARMGSAYFNAAHAVLAQLGLTVSDADLQGAIQALGAQGLNIDTFLAEQADLLETRRQRGLLPFLGSLGGAP